MVAVSKAGERTAPKSSSWPNIFHSRGRGGRNEPRKCSTSTSTNCLRESAVSTLEMKKKVTVMGNKYDEYSGSESRKKMSMGSMILANLVMWSERRSTEKSMMRST